MEQITTYPAEGETCVLDSDDNTACSQTFEIYVRSFHGIIGVIA